MAQSLDLERELDAERLTWLQAATPKELVLAEARAQMRAEFGDDVDSEMVEGWIAFVLGLYRTNPDEREELVVAYPWLPELDAVCCVPEIEEVAEPVFRAFSTDAHLRRQVARLRVGLRKPARTMFTGRTMRPVTRTLRRRPRARRAHATRGSPSSSSSSDPSPPAHARTFGGAA